MYAKLCSGKLENYYAHLSFEKVSTFSGYCVARQFEIFLCAYYKSQFKNVLAQLFSRFF